MFHPADVHLDDLGVFTEPQQGASYGDQLAVAQRAETLGYGAFFRSDHFLAMGGGDGLDDMANGRVELGLGAGWFQQEHDAYGIEFPPLGERFDRLEEQLEIITGMWSTPVGDTFESPGGHCPVTASPALPKPVQSPVPSRSTSRCSISPTSTTWTSWRNRLPRHWSEGARSGRATPRASARATAPSRPPTPPCDGG